MFRRPRSTRLARTLVALALCVLVAGLPRLLVACTGPAGVTQLEFVHAPGACCNGGHAHDPAPAGQPAAAADEDCQHAEFTCELLPQPRSGGTPGSDLPPPVARLCIVVATADTRHQVEPHPPATGPPRRDARTSLRASSLLLS